MYNLFDFDGTIYDGDSSIDFYLFCLKKELSIIRFLPMFLFYVFLYVFKRKSKEQMKEKFFSFLILFSNIDELVLEFWNRNEKKIKKFYKDREHINDIIISASPKFLLEPICDRLKVHGVIASDVDKRTGKYRGLNCYGEEKVKLLRRKYKKLKISEAYSDSLSDQPIIDLAEQGYYVSKNKVINWNEVSHENCHKSFFKIIFFFFIFYLVLGIFLSYHYDFTNNYNLLFDADTARIISDFSNIFGDHYRLQVHPLLVLFIQPVILFLKGITQDEVVAILIFSSVISSVSVGLIYKIFSIFQENNKISVLISLIFGFSFSNLIFTAGIELYNIAALTLICFFYLLISIFRDKVTDNAFFYLIVMGVLLASITITNYLVFLIGCFILVVSKKMHIMKILSLNGIVILVVVLLSCFQNIIWHNTPMVLQFVSSAVSEGTSEWVNFDVGINEIKNVIEDNYFNSIIGSDLFLENVGYPRIAFCDISFINIIFCIIFYLLVLYYFVKNYKKNFYLNLFLGLVVLFNTCFHLIYGNSCVFLYSQHFVYLFFLMLGINYDNNKRSKILLIIFLIYEVIINQLFFRKLLQLVGSVLNKNYYISNLNYIMIFLILLLIFGIIIFALISIRKDIRCLFNNKKQRLQDKGKIIIFMFLKFILIICMFITIQTTMKYDKFLFFDFEDYLSKEYDLNYYFSLEYISLNQYKLEYENFIDDYGISTNYDFVDIEFYLFGMADREKFIFRDNKLIKLNNEEVILELDIEDYEIIPNIYTVIFKLKNGKFGKIYENDDGIFCEIDDDIEIIDDTDISLYDFSSYKYPNVMKVLYSELLFNIENGMFRPNVIVYDEVWYRDAAIGAMVLEKTNNLELIESGIYEIEEIYDMQNAGDKEADNLGEVLYLLSLVDNPNQELIQDIMDEAERISSDGYIKGTTDFSELYYYQNAWYQFGIEKLGLETSLKMPNIIDSYTSTAWWYKKYESPTVIGGGNINYPYLAWAEYHSVGKGNLYCSASIYPLSYEAYASQANYDKLKIIDSDLVNRQNSPTHVWTAAEMLLVLFEDKV